MRLLVLIALALAAPPQAHFRIDPSGAILQDLTVTPGAVRTTDAGELCRKGFTTKAFRHTSHATKMLAYAEYGKSPDDGENEVDHLIPLTIGGADEIKNLWPQPALPIPGFHQKDKLECRLHRLICNGTMTVVDAQKCISENWYSCWVRVGSP